MLADWPVSRPRNWLALVHQPQTERELEAVRLSLQRGRPFGDESWQQRTAEQLGLEYTLRPRGPPQETMNATFRRLSPRTARAIIGRLPSYSELGERGTGFCFPRFYFP